MDVPPEEAGKAAADETDATEVRNPASSSGSVRERDDAEEYSRCSKRIKRRDRMVDDQATASTLKGYAVRRTESAANR